MVTAVTHLHLTEDERLSIAALVERITHGSGSVLLDEFIDTCAVAAHELPLRIRRGFYDLKLNEQIPGILVRGTPIRDGAYGNTPSAILPKAHERIYDGEITHLLCASLLGEPFTWDSIQHGNLINEVLPIQENADTLQSSGSSVKFGFHNEDAFHEYMGDYFGLFCIRNPTQTPTLVSFVGDCELTNSVRAELFARQFRIKENIAHEVANIADRQAVFFGSPSRPYLRVNTNYPPDCDAEPAAKAYNALVTELERHSQEVILQSGDHLYLDNFRTVHGRPQYSPQHDGGDRWLKRLYISSYLRKSRDLRDSPSGRLIHVLNEQ